MLKTGQTLGQIAPAVIVGLAVVSAPLLGLAEPVTGDQAAAVFPPGWSHRESMVAASQADLSVVRFGAFSNIGIVEFDDREALNALRDQGAWFLLHPQALGGCMLIGSTPALLETETTSNGIST